MSNNEIKIVAGENKKPISFKVAIIEFFAIIALLIFFFLKLNLINFLENDAVVLNQNLAATKEKHTQLVKNKDDQWMNEKISLMQSNEQLEKNNKDLANEIRKLNGDAASVQRLILNGHYTKEIVLHDTFYILDSDVNKIDLDFNWSHSGKPLKIKGMSNLKMDMDTVSISSKILEYSIDLDIYTGVYQDEKSKLWKAFARSDDPQINLNIRSNINPEIFNKKEDKFIIGPMVGFGFGFGVGFNAAQDGGNRAFIGSGVFVGIGATYKLWGW